MEDIVSNNIEENLKKINSKLNLLINSDIILRKFTITINDHLYNAFLIYVDGMADKNSLSEFVLKPLTIKKIKSSNNDIAKIVKNVLLQNDIKEENNFEKICSDIVSGNCAVFVESINFAYDIDVKSFSLRSISTPKNETTIKGSQEGFVENIRTNTSIIRRNINSENLVIENIIVGKVKKNQCAICYMKNIANPDLVSEAKFRLNNLSVDFVNSSAELAEFIKDDDETTLPELINTERVDLTISCLLQGRVAIIYNGSPNVLIAPATYLDFISSPEDININHVFANLLKTIRTISVIITLLLPGLYIAITTYHFEIIPIDLLFSIVSSRTNVPFQLIIEIILMEISFEIIREACLRVPSPLGSTIGIVGALVLGDAAVKANIVSPILIIIIAITGITSFAIPNYELSFHLRVDRFLYTAVGYFCGFIGIAVILFMYIAKLSSLKSFGVPYLAPYVPFNTNHDRGLFSKPPWKREYLNSYFKTKIRQVQDKKSMRWK